MFGLVPLISHSLDKNYFDAPALIAIDIYTRVDVAAVNLLDY